MVEIGQRRYVGLASALVEVLLEAHQVGALHNALIEATEMAEVPYAGWSAARWEAESGYALEESWRFIASLSDSFKSAASGQDLGEAEISPAETNPRYSRNGDHFSLALDEPEIHLVRFCINALITEVSEEMLWVRTGWTRADFRNLYARLSPGPK